LRTLANNGTAVCNFTLAVSRRFANQQGEREADFIPVVVWRTQAENCAKYLRKGSQVAVAGSIHTRQYDGTDGVRRYVTEVVADEIKFLNRTAGRNDQGMDSVPMDSTSHSMQEIDEELPF
jgi:single-strand DNA-binding protein